MAQTKADLMKEAKALGIEHVTAKQTMAELRELIAAAEPKKHDKEALPTEEHEATVAKSGKRSAKAIAEKEAEVAKEERKERAEESAEKPKAASKPARSRLERAGKKLRDAAKLVDATKEYGLNEALDTLVKTSTTKFDATVEVHINLGVDPKQADQNIRDTLVLPHGTGKAVRVAVFADADLHAAAKKAGADVVGADDLRRRCQRRRFVSASNELLGVVLYLVEYAHVEPDLRPVERLLRPRHGESSEVELRKRRLGVVTG
jgi:large subunit ribosomal protein L1